LRIIKDGCGLSKDYNTLTALYRKGISLKGGRIITGADLEEEIITKEDTIFFNQIGKGEINQAKRCPSFKSNDTALWKYSQ
jgi:hypothetical protein